MNLPANLQQEVEKWASSQDLTLEQFIFQTIAEKINRLAAANSRTIRRRTSYLL